jgi:hypothetical protein
LALAGDRQADVRIHLAKNPMAMPDVLMRLVGSGQKIDALVAIHPHATPTVLRQLIAKSCDIELALRILRRPNLTPSVLAVLAEHKNWEILRIVYHHPLSRYGDGSLRTGIARRLYAKILGHYYEYAEDRWGEEGDRLMGYVVLHQAATPQRTLKMVSSSLYWLRRLAVARHPNTCLKLRKRLAEQDGNRFVRAAARDALANGVS